MHGFCLQVRYYVVAQYHPIVQLAAQLCTTLSRSVLLSETQLWRPDSGLRLHYFLVVRVRPQVHLPGRAIRRGRSSRPAPAPC